MSEYKIVLSNTNDLVLVGSEKTIYDMLVCVDTQTDIYVGDCHFFSTRNKTKIENISISSKYLRSRICTSLYTASAIIAGLRGDDAIYQSVVDSSDIKFVLSSLGFVPKIAMIRSVHREEDKILWIERISQNGLGGFYERVPTNIRILVDDKPEYVEQFHKYYSELVRKNRNTDAHFLRILREEALELVALFRKNDPQERQWLYRHPQVPNSLEGLHVDE